MHLSKLITALQTLDESRFKRLDDYIHSPFFKVPTHSVNLFDFLAPLYPKFPEKRITVETIAPVAQNLSTFSKQARAGSELLERIQDFMAFEDWNKDKKAKRFNQVRAYNEHQLITQFKWGFEDGMKELNEDTEQDIQTFLYKHLLTELRFNGYDAKLNRTIENDINPVITTLDTFYAVKKLRFLCEAHNRQRLLGTAFDKSQVKPVLQILEPYTNEGYPYVYLFVNVYRMMEESSYEESDLYFRFIKQYIERQNYISTPPASVSETMTYVVNNCLKWYNKGFPIAGEEYLWCLNWEINNNLLLENSKLLPIVFRNIVTIGAVNKHRPESSDNLIKTYSPYLPEEHAETNLAFARGLYNYVRKNYKEASRYFLLAQAKEEVIFNCIIRRWQWMALYECDPYDTDTLLNHLLSFEKYMARNAKELQNVAKVFDVFIHYSSKLVRATKTEAAAILHELNAIEYSPSGNWLIEQIKDKAKVTSRETSRVTAN